MIKTTNGLRRGNYLVGSAGEWLKVSRIYNADHVGIGEGDPYTVTGEHPCLAPIEITPETAIKLGFKKDDFYYGEGDGATEGKTCWFYNVKFPAGEYEVDGIDLKFYDEEFHGLYYGQTLVPHIKWIHQVQNLYFILTDQELVSCNLTLNKQAAR